jgi:tetratricopeptide (TPR) repeat protein
VALNKRKILDAARKYAQKGAQDKALREYAQLLQSDPKDAKLRIEVGDAYRRWGRIEEAIETYTRVAQQYTQEGFDARAVAVYKQIQTLDPQRAAVYEPLAELYQRMGLSAEAAQAYQTATEVHQKAGRKREALGALRKLTGLDPANTASRIKVAELLSQEGMKDEAIAEFGGAAEELERQRDLDGAIRCLTRMAELAPERAELQLRLAQRLIENGRAAAAEAHIKRAAAAKPKDPAALELLADLYRRLGRNAEVQEICRDLANHYRERGDTDRAREILQRIGGGDVSATFDADSSREFSEERPEEALGVADGDPSVFGAQSELDTASDLDDEPLLLVDADAGDGDDLFGSSDGAAASLEDDDDLEGTTHFTPPTPRGATAKRAVETEASADLDQLLAEASVYLRYGKRRQATENLQRILAVDPDHRPALEKFGEAQVEAGETEAAIQTWQRAYQLASSAGEHDAAAVLRDRIRALGGSAASAPAPLAPKAPAPAPAPQPQPAAPAPAPSAVPQEEEVYLDFDDAPVEVDVEAPAPPDAESDFGIDVEIDAAELGDSLSDISALTDDVEADAPAAAAPAASKSSSQSQSQQILEDLEEADFYLQQGLLDEAEAIFVRLARIAPNHPRVLVRLGEIAASRGRDPDSTASRLAVAAPAAAPLSDDSIEDLIDGAREPAAAAQPRAAAIEVELDGDAEVELGLETELDLELASERDAAMPVETGADAEASASELAGAVAAPIAVEAAPTEPLAIDVEIADVEPEAAPETVSARELAPAEPVAELLAETAADASGEFDLAAALEDEFDREGEAGRMSASRPGDAGSLGFQAVFDAFKRGVESALAPGDVDAHYDLGIAYREMGLYDDALREFQRVAASPARAIDGLHMVGVCALDLGRAAEAVTALQRGLAQPNLRREQEVALRFELGRGFELLGDVVHARESWEGVVALDPLFCDVQERLLRLEQGLKPEPIAVPRADDTAELPGAAGYESFTDLMESIEEETPAPAPEPVSAAPEPPATPRAPAPTAPPAAVPEAPSDPNDASQTKRRRRRISYI